MIKRHSLVFIVTVALSAPAICSEAPAPRLQQVEEGRNTKISVGSATRDSAESSAYTVEVMGDLTKRGELLDITSAEVFKADSDALVESIVEALDAAGVLGYVVVKDEANKRITIFVLGNKTASVSARSPNRTPKFDSEDRGLPESSSKEEEETLLEPADVCEELHKMQADLLDLVSKDPLYVDVSGIPNFEMWSSHAGQFDVAQRLKEDPGAVMGLDETNNETRWTLHRSQHDTFLQAKGWPSEGVEGDEEARALQKEHAAQYLEFLERRDDPGFLTSVDGTTETQLKALHARQYSEYLQGRERSSNNAQNFEEKNR